MMKLRLIYYVAIAIAALIASEAKAAKAAKLSTDDKLIADYITKYAAVYKLDRATFSCVLFVESSYRVNIISDTDDYGIGQINGKTLRGYKFYRIKLLTDMAYSVRSAAIVLADYQRYFAADEPTRWVARYNIGFQSLTERGVGAAYVAYNAKVQRCIAAAAYL